MKTYDYILTGCDTDSIAFCKSNQEAFSEDELEFLLDEINSLIPEKIQFEDDGVYSRFVVLKAKNYVLLPQGKTKYKIKGSSLLDSKKEPALREFMNEIVDGLVFQKNNLQEVYQKYTDEILNVKDINRWCVKKSISKKLLEGTRKNETNVLDALGDISQYREGDKVYIYNGISGKRPIMTEEYENIPEEELEYDRETNEPTGPLTRPTGRVVPMIYKSGKTKGQVKMEDNTYLKLASQWTGDDFDKVHYLQRLTDTLAIFKSVVDLTQFVDYNKKAVLIEKGLV